MTPAINDDELSLAMRSLFTVETSLHSQMNSSDDS